MTAPTTTAAPTALIGGSGFQRVPGLEITRAERIATPFGDPSDALQFGILAGREWVFLRRHGAGHRIPPHRVNYRANLWALRQAGVARIVACAAVGGIDRALPVGGLVVPEQLIDATWGRAHTFFDGAPGELDALGDLQHIDFSRPYCEVSLGQRVCFPGGHQWSMLDFQRKDGDPYFPVASGQSATPCWQTFPPLDQLNGHCLSWLALRWSKEKNCEEQYCNCQWIIM